MLCLNIQMQKIEFIKGIFQDNDTILVSVTTLPDEQKQSFSFEGKKIDCTHPFMSVKIHKRTEKILIVFRKKNFAQKGPVFASSTLKPSDFPKSFDESAKNELKNFKIFEPVQNLSKRKSTKSEDRKIIGNLIIKFSLTEERICRRNTVKCQVGKKISSRGYLNLASFDDENDLLANNLVAN